MLPEHKVSCLKNKSSDINLFTEHPDFLYLL
jgi:hypothetical protein